MTRCTTLKPDFRFTARLFRFSGRISLLTSRRLLMKWMGCGLQPLDFRSSIVAPERPDSGFSRRRIAKRGFYATAPATYTRQEDVSKMNGMETIMSALVARVTDAQINVDFDAAVAGGHGDTNRASLAGDRWGGRAARVYAGHSARLGAFVPDTGWLVGMKLPIKPQDAVDFAAAFKVPVSGLDAGVDGFVRPAAIDQMRAGLVKSGGLKWSSFQTSTMDSMPTTGRPTT